MPTTCSGIFIYRSLQACESFCVLAACERDSVVVHMPCRLGLPCCCTWGEVGLPLQAGPRWAGLATPLAPGPWLQLATYLLQTW